MFLPEVYIVTVPEDECRLASCLASCLAASYSRYAMPPAPATPNSVTLPSKKTAATALEPKNAMTIKTSHRGSVEQAQKISHPPWSSAVYSSAFHKGVGLTSPA